MSDLVRGDTPRVLNAVPTVALYGALNALFNLALAMRVTVLRRREGVSVGVGGSKPLELGVRIHANNAEYVPLALVLLLIAELSGGASLGLHLLGGTLLLARVLHAVGMPRRAPNLPRALGTGLTWTIIGVNAVWLLFLRG